MIKIQFLTMAVSLMLTGMVTAQTTSANFESESAVWQKTNAKSTSTFTVEATADGIATIKERYDDLGQGISYQVVSVGDNMYTITMTFISDYEAIYLHKMLIYIGCQFVIVGDNKMDMDAFANYLLK